MKKITAGLLALIIVALCAGLAGAEKAPVAVSHTVTGYSKGPDTVTLDYVVQVQNQEESVLNDVTLTLVPSPPYVMTKQTLSIKTLAPKEKAQLQLRLYSRILAPREQFDSKPLRFVGRYSDVDGKVRDFPIKSRPGGAK